MSKTTVVSLKKKKQMGEPIVLLTAYDCIMGQLLAEVGVDIVLVGDSLGNVFQGDTSTQSVTISQMVYHTAAVRRGWPDGFIVADMPFMTAVVSEADTVRHAGRLIQSGRADAVKIEVMHARQLPLLAAVVASGIPVMAHIGFTPQAVTQLGGYRVQGRTDASAAACLELAKQCEAQGAFSVLLELVPDAVSKQITAAVSVPVIGVGAGPSCDGQGLVSTDVVGLSPKVPQFATQYADVRSSMKQAFSSFQAAVSDGSFPTSFTQA